MGYEVLDSAGDAGATGRAGDAGATGRSDGTAPAEADVVDLDSLPAPLDQPSPWPARRRRLASAVARRAPVIARPRAALAAVVVTTLAVGALLGGLAVHRREVAGRLRAERAALLVDAALQTVDRVDQQSRSMLATLTVRLRNLGSRPVQVVTGPGPASGAIVTPLGLNGGDVAAGAATVLTLRVSVGCEGAPAEVPLVVPVRTVDRRAHDVPVDLRSGSRGVGGATRLRDLVCNQDAGITTQVSGPVDAPVLRIHNRSDAGLRFTLDDTPVMPATELAGAAVRVSVSTEPPMPVRIARGGSVDLRLVVRSRGCPGGGIQLPGGAYLQLVGQDPQGTNRYSSGLDIGVLVGAAIARACG